MVGVRSSIGTVTGLRIKNARALEAPRAHDRAGAWLVPSQAVHQTCLMATSEAGSPDADVVVDVRQSSVEDTAPLLCSGSNRPSTAHARSATFFKFGSVGGADVEDAHHNSTTTKRSAKSTTTTRAADLSGERATRRGEMKRFLCRGEERFGCCRNNNICKLTPLEHLGYFCALSLFTYLASVLKMYTREANGWSGWPVFPSLYAQMVGSFTMGVAYYWRLALERKSLAILYVGIATGFCGTITGFSAWNNEAVSVLLNTTAYDPEIEGRGTILVVKTELGEVIGWITIVIVGFGMPIASFMFGRLFACLIEDCWHELNLGSSHRHSYESIVETSRSSVQQDEQPNNIHSSSTTDLQHSDSPSSTECSCYGCRRSATWLVRLQVVLFTVLWVLATLLLCLALTLAPREQPDYPLLFVCLFGMVGTYLRWHVGALNSFCSTKFMLGTFLTNVLGTWLHGIIKMVSELNWRGDINIPGGHDVDSLPLAALSGLIYGFCGSLTTVSSFVYEMYTLPSGYAMLYGLATFLSAQIGLIVIRTVILYV